MHQLTQELKSGKMEIMEVPFPALGENQILVQNHYSVISAGTEGKTVSDARKGYIAKAKSRKKEVQQVLEMIKSNGLLSTYKFVMNKLDAPAALGYSAAGEIIALGASVKGFKVGEHVACGGAGACHAEIISVPENLCVKVPELVDLKHAAFTTLGAIAIQGIRQADLRLGENCLIIGMGLIGQLTAKILSAAGIFPICIDISQAQVEQSLSTGISDVYNRNQAGIEEIIAKFTGGSGVDAVIITAAANSLDPVEFAGKVARKKGKIVIVGAVPTGFDRANYYKKELDLRMSMSYGPGRGDINYEEKGLDYPIGYVRFTENRNMQTFVDLLTSKKIDISPLISHCFPLDQAPEAYDMILARTETFNGIVLSYDLQQRPASSVVLANKSFDKKEPNIGLIGAGNFAQGVLLPAMVGNANLVALATARGNTAKYVGTKYKFNYCAASSDQLFEDKAINTIVITTRHNSHAEYVIKAIQSNKNVFVEKPLCITEIELESIIKEYNSRSVELEPIKVMVGFNRRFAPATKEIINLFKSSQTKAINIRVNSGVMPADHWVNDPEIGGGRIIGEACHFIDLAQYLAQSECTLIAATAMDDPNTLNNTVCINMTFANGSIASINYFANGSKNLAKEQIEVFCGGTIARIDDFKSLTVYNQSENTTKYKKQDKGHAEEMRLYLKSIKDGTDSPISFEQSCQSTFLTLKVLQSIKEKRSIIL